MPNGPASVTRCAHCRRGAIFGSLAEGRDSVGKCLGVFGALEPELVSGAQYQQGLRAPCVACGKRIQGRSACPDRFIQDGIVAGELGLMGQRDA